MTHNEALEMVTRLLRDEVTRHTAAIGKWAMSFGNDPTVWELDRMEAVMEWTADLHVAPHPVGDAGEAGHDGP